MNVTKGVTIEDKETARKICEIMVDCTEQLKGTLDIIKESGQESEVEEYKIALAKVIGSIMLGIRDPLYREHPDITSDDLKDIYK